MDVDEAIQLEQALLEQTHIEISRALTALPALQRRAAMLEAELVITDPLVKAAMDR